MYDRRAGENAMRRLSLTKDTWKRVFSFCAAACTPYSQHMHYQAKQKAMKRNDFPCGPIPKPQVYMIIIQMCHTIRRRIPVLLLDWRSKTRFPIVHSGTHSPSNKNRNDQFLNDSSCLILDHDSSKCIRFLSITPNLGAEQHQTNSTNKKHMNQ